MLQRCNLVVINLWVQLLDMNRGYKDGLVTGVGE